MTMSSSCRTWWIANRRACSMSSSLTPWRWADSKMIGCSISSDLGRLVLHHRKITCRKVTCQSVRTGRLRHHHRPDAEAHCIGVHHGSADAAVRSGNEDPLVERSQCRILAVISGMVGPDSPRLPLVGSPAAERMRSRRSCVFAASVPEVKGRRRSRTRSRKW